MLEVLVRDVVPRRFQEMRRDEGRLFPRDLLVVVPFRLLLALHDELLEAQAERRILPVCEDVVVRTFQLVL
jgi:hypothetical protein